MKNYFYIKCLFCHRVCIDKYSQGNFKSIEPSYFLEAMDMYRQEFRYNKLYFSDKMFFFQKGRFHLCVWWCWLGQETATSTGKRDLMDRTATTKYICFCSKNHLLCQCFLSPGENRRPLLCGRSFARKRCSILTARTGVDNCEASKMDQNLKQIKLPLPREETWLSWLPATTQYFLMAPMASGEASSRARERGSGQRVQWIQIALDPENLLWAFLRWGKPKGIWIVKWVGTFVKTI